MGVIAIIYEGAVPTSPATPPPWRALKAKEAPASSEAAKSLTVALSAIASLRPARDCVGRTARGLPVPSGRQPTRQSANELMTAVGQWICSFLEGGAGLI